MWRFLPRESRETVLRLDDGRPGLVTVIHTFGDYARFHPHVHAMVADGLFRRNGMFHVLPKADIKRLEELFRAKVLHMLKGEGRIDDGLIRMLLSWKHSGFSVFAGNRIAPSNRKGKEALAQYIMRNAFSEDKISYLRECEKVLYRSDMKKGKNRRNFELFDVSDFIAAITQHIPEKHFQMVRYYGWYSNRAMGDRRKAGIPMPEDSNVAAACEILDVSDYDPPRVPSKTWRELIKKVWEVDPLLCPKCGEEMKVISLIHDRDVIKQILEHLGLWKKKQKDPGRQALPERGPVVYEEFDDGWPGSPEPEFTVH